MDGYCYVLYVNDGKPPFAWTYLFIRCVFLLSSYSLPYLNKLSISQKIEIHDLYHLKHPTIKKQLKTKFYS